MLGEDGRGARPTAGPVRRLSRAERRGQLLDAGAAMVAQGGAESLTMEGVALRAGVSKALPYQHFHDAEEMLAELATREAGIIASRLAAAFPPGESLEVGLRRSLRSYFDMVDQRGTLLAALFQYRFSPARKEKMDRMWASVAGLFAERFAVDPGVPPRTAEAAAHMLLSAVVGAQQVWLGGRVSRAEVEELLVRMVADGLRGVVAERATGQGDTPRRPGNSPLPAIRTEV